MSSPAEREAISRSAFLRACRAELEALKPGNVHVHAAGHGMTVDDFLHSAEAAAPPLCRFGASVGSRIRGAIAASWAVVPCNTNLGIVLLAAPLIAASEEDGSSLRNRLFRVLSALTVADAEEAFAAIRHANPGGLGRAPEQDVAARPTVTLLEAMRLAADRDLVARQYATGYEDVFTIGAARIEDAITAGRRHDWAVTLAFLDFLSTHPDSHIVRKHGLEVARAVRLEAKGLIDRLPRDPEHAFPDLLAFDGDLKRRGLNPGTSADLTVASLLVVEISRSSGEIA